MTDAPAVTPEPVAGTEQRVLIIDDHPLIRDGLTAALGGLPDVVVVGQADGVDTGLAAVARLRPDIVLVDVNLAGGQEGLDLVATLRAADDRLGIVVLTMYDDDGLVLRALQAGASAYTLKTASADAIVAAIRHAAAAPRSFSAEGLAGLLGRLSAHSAQAAAAPVLTDREVEVLRRLASGAPVAAIARQMFVSVSTLKSHISHVYAKLDVTSRTEAVLAGVRLGVVTLAPQHDPEGR